MAIMDPNKTVENEQTGSNTTTPQCGPGQKLINGVCVAIRMQSGLSTDTSPRPDYNPFPNGNPFTQQQQNQTPGSLSEIYGGIRSGVRQATATNIQSARQTAEMQQEQLNQQLEQQRQDYLKNRQNLQRETFLRGRNVLANLANRGLATSGLQQLGDVQRTIATGQQMNELSQAFERARQGLTSQQTQIATGLQQFEAGQQSQLTQQLAGLDLQEQQAGVTESERSVAYAESLSTLLSDPNIPQNIKDTLAPLYEQLITTPQATEGATPGQTGSLTEALGTTTTASTAGQQASNIVTKYGSSLSTFEKDKLNEIIGDSEVLAQGSELRTVLSGLPEGTQTEVSVTNTKGNKAGLNDTYEIVVNGQGYSVEGRELAVLIMNGNITVSPEIAYSIVQRAGGRAARPGGTIGNQWDSVLKPYLKWLDENNINENTVKNPLR